MKNRVVITGMGGRHLFAPGVALSLLQIIA